ncbi:MAG TPA: YgiT-type zinc finger protein [Anaerolineales bacterium]|nr:YgiT-type zinc finger protein [Anaerolineales bacterium]
MICLICRQAEVVNRRTSVQFERGEMTLVINSVPARVCAGCGEAFVEEDVAVWLLREAEKIAASGIRDAVIEYTSS